jgi:hypothetical protein
MSDDVGFRLTGRSRSRTTNGRFSEVNNYGSIGKFVFLKDNRQK